MREIMRETMRERMRERMRDIMRERMCETICVYGGEPRKSQIILRIIWRILFLQSPTDVRGALFCALCSHYVRIIFALFDLENI